MVHNRTTQCCQSCILQGWLLTLDHRVPACTALGQLAMPSLVCCCEHPPLKAELHIWLRVTAHPGLELAAQAPASQGLQQLSGLHHRHCPNRSAALMSPGLEQSRHPGSTGSCWVTMTPLSGLWLLLAVVELTSIYAQFSNERAGRCPGEQGSSLKPHFGMFLKTLLIFSPIFYFNSHSEVTFTSLIGLQPKKKNLLTNWKPCTSASSTLQFNCFKAEAMCCVLSGGLGKVKWKTVKKKVKLKIKP